MSRRAVYPAYDRLPSSPQRFVPTHVQNHSSHPKFPRSLYPLQYQLKSRIFPKSHLLKVPKYPHLYPVNQVWVRLWLSPTLGQNCCPRVYLGNERTSYLLPSTAVGQAQNSSYRNSHHRREKNGRKERCHQTQAGLRSVGPTPSGCKPQG